LISNALWIRANDLQQDGKYFEMVRQCSGRVFATLDQAIDHLRKA